MTIILDDLEPGLLAKLKDQAVAHGRTLAEEIKVILTQKLDQPKKMKTPEELGWSEGFFEKTAGACADDPIRLDSGGIDSNLDQSLANVFNE